MDQLTQIGEPTPLPSVREMFERLAQREAEEIKRLKELMSVRSTES
jgi:hypothetical protein